MNTWKKKTRNDHEKLEIDHDGINDAKASLRLHWQSNGAWRSQEDGEASNSNTFRSNFCNMRLQPERRHGVVQAKFCT